MHGQIMALMGQKDEIEAEVAQLTEQINTLEQNKNYNLSLVDTEGFPRPDLNFGELAEYRALKRRRAELSNDHSALMKQIENKMFALHAAQPQPQTVAS